MSPCAHCSHPTIYRRGLCRRCYYKPAVRFRYRTLLGAYTAGTPTASSSPLPAHPTTTAPGSEERLQVLEDRALRGEALFHPDDATLIPAGVAEGDAQGPLHGRRRAVAVRPLAAGRVRVRVPERRPEPGLLRRVPAVAEPPIAHDGARPCELTSMNCGGSG